VVRCSDCEAVHKDGRTLLKVNAARGDGLPKLIELEPPTQEGMSQLRSLYAEENITDAAVDYARHGPILFSMNEGDYARPVMHESTVAESSAASSAEEFRSLVLPTDANLFDQLLTSVRFEHGGKGRQGAVIVRPDGARGCPIVRTTSKYSLPAQCFQPVHEQLARQIQQTASLPASFNNALVECYSSAYTKMGFHSDMALDLHEGTSIALFSCYRHPEQVHTPRKLVVEAKQAGGGGAFEISLTHNSLVVFSLDTNRRFRHKIVLDVATTRAPNPGATKKRRAAMEAKMPPADADETGQPSENEWLGVTFRTSKTFVVAADDGHAHFPDGTALTMAHDEQRKEFYTLRARENAEVLFAYPRLAYTLSESDLMPPVDPP